MTAANRPDANPDDRAPARRSEAVEQAAQVWTEADRRDVAAWLTREADQRVLYFPQRRDGIDALIRHLAANLLATTQGAGDGEARVEWLVDCPDHSTHIPTNEKSARFALTSTCTRATLHRRTAIRFRDRIGPWEPVDQQAAPE